MMAARFLLAAVLGLAFEVAVAAEPPAEACEQIRSRIGVAPPADPELLRQLSQRKDCRFTAAEVYRAAYGDRPLPPPEAREEHRHGHDEDDD